jgi:hypothetical protein
MFSLEVLACRADGIWMWPGRRLPDTGGGRAGGHMRPYYAARFALDPLAGRQGDEQSAGVVMGNGTLGDQVRPRPPRR